MPYVRLQLAATQLNDMHLWNKIVSLLPEDEPLREKAQLQSGAGMQILTGSQELSGSTKVKALDGKEYEFDNTDLIEGPLGYSEIVPRIIPLDAPEVKEHLNTNKELLDTIEEKYKGTPGSETLMQYVELIRIQENALSQGIGTDMAPGRNLVKSFNGVEKMQDVLLNIESKDKNNSSDPAKWSYKDPVIVDQSMKEFGLDKLMDAYVDIHKHGVEWETEWKKEKCDPEKLREIGEKYKTDMGNLEKSIQTFEKKFLEDDKLPEDQKKIYNLFIRDDIEKKDVISDPSKNEYRGRSINGEHWEEQKKSFENALENYILAADLKKLQRENAKAAAKSPFSGKVQKLIDDCTNEYEADRRNNKYQKQAYAFTAIMRQQELEELREQARQYPKDSFAKKVAAVVENHLNDALNINAMETYENIDIERSVKEVKLDKEDAMLQEMQGKLMNGVKSEKDCPADKDPDEFFKEQKEAFMDSVAEVIAVKTVANTIKAHKVGNEEIGEKMSEDELREYTDEVLNEESINFYKKELLESGEFKIMMDGVKSWKSLDNMRQSALNAGAEGLMDSLAQARKELISEQTQAERMERQNELTAQKNEPINQINMM